MISFIVKNLGTIAIGLVLAGIAAAIVVRLGRDKKKGKCAGCDGCPGRADCGMK